MKGYILHILCLMITRFSNVADSSNGGLKWVRVNVPQYRIPGDMAKLECDYDLGNDSLYSVKWYKDHEEFYRYVPRARPEASSYKVEGISVGMSQSDRKTVVLNDINLKSSGLFRCEVSAEAPTFSSAQSEARMEVVYLPKEDPTITGVKPQYQIGDELNLNCTSGKSHPVSILQWFINDQQVTNSAALIQYKSPQPSQDLMSSKLGLRITLKEQHFHEGSMRVKCVASVSPVLWRGNKESIVQSLPINEMREALLLVKNCSEKIRFYYTLIMLILTLQFIS